MVLGTTTTAQVINPQVMADMVSAKLPKLIKFTPLAVVFVFTDLIELYKRF